MRFLIVVAIMLASLPAVAGVTINYPVTIPQECFELARREGVPTVITNETEARKAQVKLAQMRDNPLVRGCRSAVARARHLYESNQ